MLEGENQEEINEMANSLVDLILSKNIIKKINVNMGINFFMENLNIKYYLIIF